MFCSRKLYVFVIITIFHERSSAQLDYISSRAEKKVENDELAGDQMTDNVAEAAEHHKIVILVPQILHQEKKPPKSHHHHHKVLPVVHSGKVIHAHHHHGRVDHVHAHKANAKHEHKHHLNANHKHNHFGVGSHKHSHAGKASHHHKHEGDASHKHDHTGKGIVHHVHDEHHHHQPPPKPPTKKFTNPFSIGGRSDPDETYFDAAPRIKIDSQILRALNPAVGSSYANLAHPPRIIQIRIPDENENVVKEIDIDTQSDLAVLKKNYITFADDTNKNADDGFDWTGNLEEVAGHGDETEETAGEYAYQLGDGYKLAGTAAAVARARASAEDNGSVYNVFDREQSTGMEQILPSTGFNDVIAYSDSFRYQ